MLYTVICIMKLLSTIMMCAMLKNTWDFKLLFNEQNH